MPHPVCLYGHSALEFWRVARGVPAPGDVPASLGDLDLPPSVADVERRLPVLPVPLRRPVELLVTHRRARRAIDGARVHYCAVGLPTGSVVQASDDVLVPTPALCFLQMARTLSLPELVQLGFELCGTYAPATSDSEHLRMRDAPLASAGGIRRLVSLMPGATGHKQALRAAAYLRDGSRSPMETASALLLGLPRRLGGKGLPAMRLNHRVDFDAQAKRLARRSYALCDLFWPEANLDVEYEGRAFHTGERNMASDKNRLNALNHMGVRVISLFDEHMRDDDALNAVAADIARALSFRLRAFTDEDAARTRELRRALFVRPGSARPAWPGLRADSPLINEALAEARVF